MTFRPYFSSKALIKSLRVYLFFFFLVFSAFFGVQSATTSSSEDASTKYLIPSYYGSRDQDFLIKGFAVASNYSSFYWTHGVDMDDSTPTKNYYLIDTSSSSIKKVSATGVFTTIALTTGGFRNGKLSNALFSSSIGLVYYRQSKRDVALQQYRTIVVLQDSSNACKTNAASCQDTTLTVNSIINPALLYELYNVPSSITLPSSDDYEDPALVIADTGNNCIRKINLTTQIVTTIAGQCTIDGFKDGPFGTNLMGSPTSLGVDSSGIIFFYDGKYDYIRMIDPVTTFVSTLQKGACRKDVRFDPVLIKGKYYKTKVICYKNWLDINSQLQEYSEVLSSICQLQQSLCTTTTSSST